MSYSPVFKFKNMNGHLVAVRAYDISCIQHNADINLGAVFVDDSSDDRCVYLSCERAETLIDRWVSTLS